MITLTCKEEENGEHGTLLVLRFRDTDKGIEMFASIKPHDLTAGTAQIMLSVMAGKLEQVRA